MQLFRKFVQYESEHGAPISLSILGVVTLIYVVITR